MPKLRVAKIKGFTVIRLVHAYAILDVHIKWFLKRVANHPKLIDTTSSNVVKTFRHLSQDRGSLQGSRMTAEL